MPYSRFVTPDTRTKRVEEHTQREFQRKLRLDAVFKQKSDEIKLQMEQEKARGTGLDLNTQMETERARSLELNKRRFQEVERRFDRTTGARTIQEILETGESPLGVAAAGGRVSVPQFDPGRGLIETVGKGIELEQEAEFRVNKFILEQMDTPPEQFPEREEFGAFQGRLTEEQRANLRSVPVVGPALEREVEFLSSPAGLGTALAFPGQVAAGAGGGIAAATTAQELGASENVQLAAQVAGNVLAPGGGIVPATAVTRPVGAAARTGRELVGEAAERARLAPEVGGGPLRGGQELLLPDELRLYSEGVPPPKKLPTGEIPERGGSGAQQVLDFKEETLLEPGRTTQFPGVKQAASGLNPSVPMERNVLVSYNGRQAAGASLETEFAAARQSPLDELKAVFREDPPRYKGPDNNPFKNTLKDWGDNPEFYTLTERHRAAAAAYNAVGDQTLARSSGEFGVKVEPFPVKKGGFFSPTVATRESLDEGLKKVTEGYTSASVSARGARTKTRVYEGAYQRWQNNPSFRAETNLDELTGLHDRALSKLSGDETFRLGAGGKTRIELMEQLHPALFQRMTGLRQRLASLRGTAGRLNKKLGEAIDGFLSAPGDVPLSDLADALDVTITRGIRKGVNVKAINAEIRAVRQEIRKLRPAWEAANLEPFVLNRKTFRFHQPEQSAAIDKILQTKLNIGQGFADAIDEVRLTAFAGDVSPLTIQGLLGGLSHPLVTATNARNIVRSLWNPDELLKIATREPGLVERFTRATGRPFGEAGPEFVQQFKGIERARIPFTKLRPGHALNRRLMAAVEEIRYAAWKTDQDLLRKLNPGMTQNVADAEAANFLSKMIPALNPAETGRSVLRARFERIPIISSSFLASPPALMKDIASGLAKLGASTKLSPLARWQALSGREQLAILRGLNLAGSLSALTVGSYIASGFSPEEAVKKALDPTGNNPRFLSIALGKDRYIPIGGPVRSFIRGMVPEKIGEVEGVPIYVPFTNTKNWLLGKVTPAVKAPIDIARNEDFFGGKIATGSFPENILRAVWYGANSVLPLAAAEPSEAIRRGEVEPTDIGELAIRGGGQLAGSDIRELRLREAFERETGRSYSETPSVLRRRLIADSPFLTRLAEQQEVFFPDEGKRIRTERSTELLPHAQAALQGGLEAVRAYNDNRKFIMAKFGGVSEEVFGDLDIEPQGRDNELLSQYYEVDFRADHNGNGIPGDDEDVRLALEEQDGLKSQMSSGVQDALNNPENFFVDPEVIEYETLRREGVDTIREILELPKWQGLTVEEGDALDDLVSRIQADVQRYKAQAVREGGDSDSVTFRSTAEWLVGRGTITELDAENAIAVSSGNALRDAGRVNLALESREILLGTFPDFFGSVLPAETERAALTEEEIEQLQPAGVR